MTPSQRKIIDSTLSSAHQEYEKKMLKHAFLKINNHNTCNDVVQETFLKTFKYLMKGGEIVTMKAFLYHVLNHLITDEHRKRKATSLDALIEKGFEPSADESERLFNTIDGRIAIDCIQYLPAKYRQVIILRFIKLLSLKEISLVTGQSKNTTAVQIYRGLEKLKVIYSK